MEINCSYGHHVYRAGGLVLVLIKGSMSVITNPYREAVVLAQVHGHATLDSRWLSPGTNVNDVFLQVVQGNLDQKVHIPRHFHTSIRNSPSFCIFMTPREVIQISSLFEEGVFLQFELPHDTLPSYRGIMLSINYYITLSVQLPNGTRHIHIPLKVSGRGDVNLSQQIRYSALTIYPSSSLPPEATLLPLTDVDGNDDVERLYDEECFFKRFNGSLLGLPIFRRNQSPKCVYTIRDEDDSLVCKLGLYDTDRIEHFTPVPGQSIIITLDFEHLLNGITKDGHTIPAAASDHGRSHCQAVRARLIQKELRLDGSKIQEKIIDTAVRNTQDAINVYLQLQIPENAPNTFVCPIAQVRYDVAVEFYLHKSTQSPREPFSWVLPLDISPPGDIGRWPRCEAVSCFQPAVVWESTASMMANSQSIPNVINL